MRLLITNDDGIESEGLHVLTAALAEAGHDVLVVAPDRDWSGASAGLGRFSPDEHIEVRPVDIPGCGGAEAWSIAGPPGLAVLATRLGSFGAQPDLVVSGINPGANTGRAVLHSGTVGAALTAQNMGWSGLAVSMQWSGSGSWPWETAARFALDALELIADAPPRSVLNLNVPALPFEEVKELRWARLAPFGEVRAATDGVTDGRLQLKLEGGEQTFDPDTDAGMIADGYASLTALVGIVEAWPADTGLDAAEGLEMFEGLVPGAPLREVHRLPDASQGSALLRPSPASGP